MTWKLLLSILLLASGVASYPLNPYNESSQISNHVSAQMENEMLSSSGDHGDVNMKETSNMDKEEDMKSTSSSYEEAPEKDEGKADKGETKRPKYCTEPFIFTIVQPVYRYINGERKNYNISRVVITKKCCKGYKRVGKRCWIDLCRNRTCQEDPQSKCVTLERCGHLLPVFLTAAGTVSDTCTQPVESQEHLSLCPNNTSKCESSSQCAGYHNGEAVCFSSKCDCTPGPVWLLHNGKEALCSN